MPATDNSAGPRSCSIIATSDSAKLDVWNQDWTCEIQYSTENCAVLNDFCVCSVLKSSMQRQARLERIQSGLAKDLGSTSLIMHASQIQVAFLRLA